MQRESISAGEDKQADIPIAVRVRQRSITRRPPRPTRETPRTQLLLPKTRAGWLKVTGISLGVVLVIGLALLGLRLLTVSDCQEFTTERTAVAIDGFGIEVRPSDLLGSFGVKLSRLGAQDSAALDNLPPTLTPVSAPVVIQACSVDPRLSTLRMRIPEGVEDSAELDLYGWYERTKTWSWLGGERAHETREVIAHVPRLPSLAVMVKVGPIAPTIGAEVPPVEGDPAALLSAIPPFVSEVYATGVYLGDFGRLSGDAAKLLRPAQSSGVAIKAIPIVRNWGVYGDVGRTLLQAMLSDEAGIAIHIDAILKLVDGHALPGVAIDYRGVGTEQREAFAQLIELLGAQLDKRGKALFVVVPAPGRAPDATARFDAAGYDLYRIGRAASRVQLDLTTQPEALYGEGLDALIQWAAGQVDRHKLQVVIPTLSVQKDALERVRLLGFSEALSALGPLQPVKPAALPGERLQLWWDKTKIMPSDVFYAARGRTLAFTSLSPRGVQQTTWLNTAASLKEVLARVRRHNLRGVALRGLTHFDHDATIAPLISRFAQGNIAALEVPEPMFKVAFDNGTPFSLSLAEAQQEMSVQAPGGEGDYQVTTTFQSVRSIALGTSRVRVSADAQAGAASAEETTSVSTAQPIGGLLFEVGGYVNDLVHAVQMKSVGMTWARTEVRDEVVPTAFINSAKQKGLKVLITAVGDRSRAMNIDYRDQWVQFLAKLAAAGADAIQVWREPNYQLEWPAGQISGASYADLLKRAYFAIKQVNPNVLVISAGLAQTSGIYGGGCAKEGCDELAFLRQMANQSAQDYMDCVGVNYTSGSSAPGVIQNNRHYLHYFGPLRNAYFGAFNGARPLCFTALGYVTKEGIADQLPEAYKFAANITLNHQATWLAEAIQIAKASGQVRLVIIWNVDATSWVPDEPALNTPGDPQAGYAMIRPDGTCPACETLRSVLK